MLGITYERNIIEKINILYSNFYTNASSIFIVPHSINEYWSSNTSLSNKETIIDYSVLFEKCLDHWIQKDGKKNKLILLHHHASSINSGLKLLAVLQQNLLNADFLQGIVQDKKSMDVLTGSVIQIFKENSRSLVEKYKNYNLDNRSLPKTNDLNDHLVSIQDKFKIMNFKALIIEIDKYIKLYETASKELLERFIIDSYDKKLITTWVEYLETYYILGYSLVVLLHYPLQRKRITLEEFDELVPKMSIFK